MSAVIEFIFGFIKSPLGIALLLIAVVFGGFGFFGSIEKVETWLGFNTKENLEHKLDQAHQNVATLDQANTSNQKAVEIAETAKDNGEKASVAKTKDEVKTTKVVEKIKVEKDKEISDIQKSDVSPEDKVEATSLVQITSIWKTYCSLNQDETCPADMPYTPLEVPQS